MKVHVLVTVRKPELLRGSTLVFDSIRTGFPRAEVIAHLNGAKAERKAVNRAFDSAAVDEVLELGRVVHHDWIEQLLIDAREPFWICDTDVLFWQQVDGWRFNGPMAGRYVPQWNDPYSRCIQRGRLHTSLMWLHPARIKGAVAEYNEGFPQTPFGHERMMVRPFQYAQRTRDGRRQDFFCDTMGGLYHAIGGDWFSEEQLDAYDHLNCGTWVDEMAPAVADLVGDLKAQHDAIYARPDLARGAWRRQQAFYERLKA